MACRYAAESGPSWTDEQIEKLARGLDGVVGQMVRRTDDLAQAHGAMDRALEWQHHLFAAGAYEAAGEIVTAVYDILARWGERDRAKALLRGMIDTWEGFGKAVAQGNLATLLKDEGKLDEALAIHEELYRTFEALGARQQMATALNIQSQVLQDMGRYDEAIAKQEASLRMKQEDSDEEGQAISLHQLSMLYRHKGDDYATAMARSQEAAEIDRKRGDQAGLAADLHEQGLILNELARTAQTDEEGTTHRRAAVERFQQSLAIKRRIGDQAGAASTLGELGKLLRDAGQMREAIAATTEALEIVTRLGNPAKMAIGLEQLGTIHESQGQYAAALEKYQQALELKRKYMGPQNVALTEANIARVQAKLRGG
jgi:tetratricopeptide (TPR) repeat protein